LHVNRDGTIVALSAEIIGDVGAYSVYPWTAVIEPIQAASFMPGPYRVPFLAMAVCRDGLRSGSGAWFRWRCGAELPAVCSV
jgi:hypothetical protein